MKRLLCSDRNRIILLVTAILVSLLMGSAASFGEEETPVIYMLRSPALGEDKECMGIVRMADGSECANLSDYRIIFYIQLNENRQYYVKPGLLDKDDHFKTIELDGDGNFSGLYYSYGDGMQNDLNAKYIHVFLVPSTFIPTLDGYGEALNACLDYVTITRGTDGSVSVSPDRVLEINHSKRADLPVDDQKIAVNIGFYTTGNPGDNVSQDKMRSLLEAVKPYSDTVRFYSASGTINKAYQLANDLGFDVIGNAWISGNKSEDKSEMDALIALANKGLIKMAVVGSETQYAGLVDEQTLIEDIEYVRERLKVDIPVTTAETLGKIVESTSLRKACDVLFVNSYPIYEDGVTIDNALEQITRQLDNLQVLGNGKQVIVSETGWPTDGSDEASEANAARYFEEIRQWSLSSGINIVYFEAFDEAWKVSDEADYGDHWGMMTGDMALKSFYSVTQVFRDAGFEIMIPHLPEGTVSLDESAFEDCAALEYLYIPPSVEEISDTAFENCPDLTIVAQKDSNAYAWAVEHDMKVLGV